MVATLPPYYFRVRETGAFVYRVTAENRQGRMEMTQIAVANIRNDQIKPHGDHQLTKEETRAIRTWMAERTDLLRARHLDDIRRTLDHLNQTAHWVQSDASDAELDEVSDALLLAMHDLRSVLVRKKSNRLRKPVPKPD